MEDLFCYSAQKRSYLLGEKINQIFHSVKCWHVPAKGKAIPWCECAVGRHCDGSLQREGKRQTLWWVEGSSSGTVSVCGERLPSVGPSGCALGTSPHSLSSSPAMCGVFCRWPSAMHKLRACKKGTDLEKWFQPVPTHQGHLRPRVAGSIKCGGWWPCMWQGGLEIHDS